MKGAVSSKLGSRAHARTHTDRYTASLPPSSQRTHRIALPISSSLLSRDPSKRVRPERRFSNVRSLTAILPCSGFSTNRASASEKKGPRALLLPLRRKCPPPLSLANRTNVQTVFPLSPSSPSRKKHQLLAGSVEGRGGGGRSAGLSLQVQRFPPSRGAFPHGGCSR